MSVVERKYALIKIKTGDYLLPSNDGETIYRIATYIDGPSMGLDWPRDRTLWGIWDWNGEEGPMEMTEDPTDWDHWLFVEGMFDQRRSAIEAALNF